MADINSSEERSTRDHYSLTGNPLIPSLTGPVNLHPSSQYPSNTAGHSTTSTSTPNNGLGNRPRNVPSRASQAGADVGVVR
jgi:hypothetical protein